jgi:DNA polymerase I-like protein with 3'-5' exonuclease and polymerase domains
MTRIDTDGRFRSSYAPYAETGRFRSSEAPLSSGGNAQNIDRETRDIYLPDEGKIFLGCDLSTAEDRITKALTKAPKLIERARLHPTEHDEHKLTATIIFRKKAETITKVERYLGKRCRHASNYGMKGQRLSDSLITEGYVVGGEECQGYIDSIMRADPEIEGYHRDVRRKLMQTRKLTTPWGRVIDYSYERMDDDLYRRGYAYVPQSSCADLLNQWGFKPLAKFIQETCPEKAAINQNGHDSLLVSVVPEMAWVLATFLQQMLEQPVNYEGVELTIPVEFQMGTTWKMEFEYKRLPGRKAFTEDAMELWEKAYNRCAT